MAPSILITGGGGRLASWICRAGGGFPVLMRRDRLDVTSFQQCMDRIDDIEPDIIIHTAAILSTAADKDRVRAWTVNVCGTENITDAAQAIGAKLVYISTDYVFDGENDGVPYIEDDPPNPINFYGVTKLMGELQALQYENSLVLRAPFRYSPWPYEAAFVDQWTSGRWLPEVAADIIRAAQSSAKGILHIGGPRKSVYEMAQEVSPNVKRMWRSDWPSMRIPRDTALDSGKWEAMCR